MTSEVPAAFAEVFKDMDGSNVAKVNKALARALGGLIGQELDQVSRGTVQARQRAPYRNRLINGDFCVQQYGGAATIAANTTVVPIDRWRVHNGTAVNLTAQQIDAPAGFSGRKALQLTGTGVAAGAGYIVAQRIEAWMIADLDSRAGVVSFDLDASTSAGSLTGKVELYGNTAVDNGTYSALLASTAFTIPSGAGRVVVPLTAAQMAGVKYGCGVFFNFTQAGATGNPTIKFGGAQIEDDPTGAGKATPFEFRPYGVELTMSQRYFVTSYPAGVAAGAAATYTGQIASWLPAAAYYAASPYIAFPVPMRTTPTITVYSSRTGAAGKVDIQNAGADVNTFMSSFSPLGYIVAVDNVSTPAADVMRHQFTASAEL